MSTTPRVEPADDLIGEVLARDLFVGNAMPGNDADLLVRVQAGYKLTGLKVVTVTAPTFTTAGTYVITGALGIAGAGTNVLAAANFDLTTLVAQTDTDIPLSAVAGVLEFAAAGFVLFNVASDNADLAPAGVGDGLYVTVYGKPI